MRIPVTFYGGHKLAGQKCYINAGRPINVLPRTISDTYNMLYVVLTL